MSTTIGTLRARFQIGDGRPVSDIVGITPDIATALLEQNPENRHVSQRQVELFAEDMRHNRWKLNGEAIIIARDGQLNDGQHRLWAVIAAEKTVDMLVVYGVERDTRDTLDMGRQRTSADVLSMEGVKQSGTAAT